jgi:hypothetical protein
MQFYIELNDVRGAQQELKSFLKAWAATPRLAIVYLRVYAARQSFWGFTSIPPSHGLLSCAFRNSALIRLTCL